MTKILEVVSAVTEVQSIVQTAQREDLQAAGCHVHTLDLSSTPASECAALLQETRKMKPDFLLVRGVEKLPAIMEATFPTSRLILDHNTPVELGRMSPMAKHLRGVYKALCYSELAEVDLRRAGLGRLAVMDGPYLPEWVQTEPPEGRMTVAVLNVSSGSQDVLYHILKIRKQQDWDFDVISSMRAPKSLKTEWDYDAAERAHVIVAPYEDKDFGQPHDGAILALGLGRPLITCRMRSFELLPYTNKTFSSATRYSIGTYAASIGNYLRDPQKHSGPKMDRINRRGVVDKILEWIA